MQGTRRLECRPGESERVEPLAAKLNRQLLQAKPLVGYFGSAPMGGDKSTALLHNTGS